MKDTNKIFNILLRGCMLLIIVFVSVTNLAAQVKPESLINTVPVGNGPSALIVGNYPNLYVANELGNTISVVNLERRSQSTVIPVGVNPKGLTFGWPNSNLYVSNKGSDTVSVIDYRNIVIATIPVGDEPAAGEYANGYVYVANFGSDSISVIDSGTSEVIDTIPTGNGPADLTFVDYWDSQYVHHSEIWVANSLSNDVSVIDTSTNTIIATVPDVGSGPSAITRACNNEVYVANKNGNNVRVLSAEFKSAGAVIGVGVSPSDITERTCGEIIAANSGSNTVSVIDSYNKVIKETFAVGKKPSAVSCYSAECYIANYDDDTVTVARFDSDLSVAVFLDGCTTCRAGGHFKAVARIRNVTARAVSVECKAGVIFPDGTTMAVSVLPGKHYETTIPSPYEGFVTLLDVDVPNGLAKGWYQYCARLEDPELGVDISASCSSFYIE